MAGRVSTHLMIDRLCKILELLRDNKRVNCTGLAVDLEVSTKTILRDIEYLRDRGYGIEWINEELSYQLVSAPEPVL